MAAVSLHPLKEDMQSTTEDGQSPTLTEQLWCHETIEKETLDLNTILQDCNMEAVVLAFSESKDLHDEHERVLGNLAVLYARHNFKEAAAQLICMKPGSTIVPSTCAFQYCDLSDDAKAHMAALPVMLCEIIARFCPTNSFRIDGEDIPALQAVKLRTLAGEMVHRVRGLAKLVADGKWNSAPCVSGSSLCVEFAGDKSPPVAVQTCFLNWLRFAVFYTIVAELVREGRHCVRYTDTAILSFIPRICADGTIMASNTLVDDALQHIILPGLGARVAVCSPEDYMLWASRIDTEVPFLVSLLPFLRALLTPSSLLCGAALHQPKAASHDGNQHAARSRNRCRLVRRDFASHAGHPGQFRVQPAHAILRPLFFLFH